MIDVFTFSWQYAIPIKIDYFIVEFFQSIEIIIG